MPSLTIAIPTYSRAQKLMRTLENLDREIGAQQLKDPITVIVSDNCSEDNTKQFVESFHPSNYELRYFRQSENMGFDRNLKFVYDQADSEYVWFMGDDDLLTPGAILKVLTALATTTPDLLLFSFRQPPDSKVRTFEVVEPYEVITSSPAIVELVVKYPKITIYVLRKLCFSESQEEELRSFIGTGFIFLDIAFSVLDAAVSPKLCVIAEQLAACDPDYLKDVFDPGAILGSEKAMSHPFVLKHLPELPERQRSMAYRGYLQFLFAYKTGALHPHNPAAYETAIKKIDFRVSELIVQPKTLLQFILLKTNCARFYLLLRPVVAKIRQLLSFSYGANK